MPLLFDILSWICLAAGSLFAVVGGIGVIRLPDVYARLHGAGITDTRGAGWLILGLMLQSIQVGMAGTDAHPWLVTVKLLMILAFLLMTSPTSCHALSQAAMTHGLRPWTSDGEEETRQ